MIKVELNELIESFGVKNKEELIKLIDCSAPSIVEYKLNELADLNEDTYLNLKNIETTVTTYSGDVYFTYSDECFIDLKISEDIDTGSFI